MLQSTFNDFQNAAIQAHVELVESLLQDIERGERMPLLNNQRVTLREKTIAAYFLYVYTDILTKYRLADIEELDSDFKLTDNRHSRSDMRKLIAGVNRFTGLGLNSGEDFILDRESPYIAVITVTSATVTRISDTSYSVVFVISLVDPITLQAITKTTDVAYTLNRINVNGGGSTDILTGVISAGQSRVTRTITTTTAAGLENFVVSLDLQTSTLRVGVSPTTQVSYLVPKAVVDGDIVLLVTSSNIRRLNPESWSANLHFSLVDSLDMNKRRRAPQTITFDHTVSNVNNAGGSYTIRITIPSNSNGVTSSAGNRRVQGRGSFNAGVAIANISGGIQLATGSISSMTIPAAEAEPIQITPSLTLQERGNNTSILVRMTLASAATSNVTIPYRLNNFLDGNNPTEETITIESGQTTGEVTITRPTVVRNAYTITGVFNNPPTGFSFSPETVTLDVTAITQSIKINQVLSTGRRNEPTYGLSLVPQLSAARNEVTNFSVRVTNVDGEDGSQDFPVSIPANALFDPIVVASVINIATGVLGNGFDIGLELVNLPQGFIFDRSGRTTASVDSFLLNAKVVIVNIVRVSATAYNLQFVIHHVNRDDDSTLEVRGKDSTMSYRVSNVNGAGSTVTNSVTFGEESSSFEVNMANVIIDNSIGSSAFNISIDIISKPNHIDKSPTLPLTVTIPSAP